jgi:hypothetical protein
MGIERKEHEIGDEVFERDDNVLRLREEMGEGLEGENGRMRFCGWEANMDGGRSGLENFYDVENWEGLVEEVVQKYKEHEEFDERIRCECKAKANET